jgi:hypothetical protein
VRIHCAEGIVQRGIAKISDDGCIVLLPADTPYDLQAVLDEVDWRATRHGPLRVELNSRVWRVDAPGAEPTLCGVCGRALRVRYVNDSQTAFCVTCAAREFRSGRPRRSASKTAMPS